MAQPHHYVFDSVHHVIEKDVKVADIAVHLVDKKIIKTADASRYERKPKNRGMAPLLQRLRNRSFETFLDFVECIFLAQGAPSGKLKSIPVVESIIEVVRDYDKQHQSEYTDRVIAVREKYVQTEPHKEGMVQMVDCATKAQAVEPTETIETCTDESSGSEHQNLSRIPVQSPTESAADDLTPVRSLTQEFEVNRK